MWPTPLAFAGGSEEEERGGALGTGPAGLDSGVGLGYTIHRRALRRFALGVNHRVTIGGIVSRVLRVLLFYMRGVRLQTRFPSFLIFLSVSTT